MAADSAAEWERFLTARNGDAIAAKEMLAAHVKWRKESLPLPPAAPQIGCNGMPAFCSFLDCKCKAGSKVLLVLGAMYDNSTITAAEYALAVAAYIDKNIARDQPGKFTVLVDARGGDNWPNPRPWSVLPWIKALVSLLTANFPERLGRLVIYPVPWVATAVWSAASQLLDERTAAKCVMLSGPAARTEPIPSEISQYVSDELLQEMHAFRDRALHPETAPQPAAEAAAAPAVTGKSAEDDGLAKQAAALELS